MSDLSTTNTGAPHNLARRFAVFGIGFFLLTTVLTAFVIIPNTNKLLITEHSQNIQTKLALEAKLFTNYVNSKRIILQDLAQTSSLVAATMLSETQNQNLIDIFDNIVIGGKRGNLVLQDIAGTVIIKTAHEFQDFYSQDVAWVNRIVEDEIPYQFKLLGQSDGQFTYRISVPVRYRNATEGVLSAEITAPLEQIFVSQSIEHVAFRLEQIDLAVRTDSRHIEIAREDAIELEGPNLTFTYISDDALIRNKEHINRNRVLLVLFSGLGASFLMFTLFEYRNLTRQSGDGSIVVLSRRYAAPIAMAIIGIAASITAYFLVQNTQQALLEKTHLTDSKDEIRHFQEEIENDLSVLGSTKAFFDASNFIDRIEFDSFVTDVTRHHPNIQSLSWVPHVLHSDRVDFEDKALQDGIPNYSIRQLDDDGDMVPADERGSYFPVSYVAPMKGNEKTLGYDLSSNSQLQSTLSAASVTGGITETAQAILMEREESEQIMLVFYPVYNKKITLSNSATDGLNTLKGFILLELLIRDIVASAQISNYRSTELHIKDISDSNNPKNIVGEKARISGFSYIETINVAGRTWRIVSTRNLAVDPMWWISWLILASGIVVTLLITIWIASLTRRQEIVETLVKVRTSELRMLSSVVDNSNDAFLIMQADEVGKKRNVYVNNAFTQLTGYSSDEAIGNTFSIVHGDETDGNLLKTLGEELERGNSFRSDFVLYKKNGSKIWVDVNAVPLIGDDQQHAQSAIVLQNISERKKSEKERIRLIEKLTDSNQQLGRFAFICSHDLQEPLRMIRSFSEKLQGHILRTYDNDEKGSHYREYITDGAIRSQQLIADVLDYSSIDNDKQKLRRTSSLDIVNSIRKNMLTDLEVSGAKITHDELPDVAGNNTQLYQLFQNLINNSLKYQNSSTASHVHIGAVDAGEHWRFSVKDNGIGIDSRHIHKIFDVFQRLHRRSQFAGTGIGLAICKKVVERHGGTLWVESELGVGSIFYFTLLKPMNMEIVDERKRKAS